MMPLLHGVVEMLEPGKRRKQSWDTVCDLFIFFYTQKHKSTLQLNAEILLKDVNLQEWDTYN